METTATQTALLPYRHSTRCETYFAGLAAADVDMRRPGARKSFGELLEIGARIRATGAHSGECDCGQRALRIVEEELRIVRKSQRAGGPGAAGRPERIGQLVEQRNAIRAELEVTA